MKRNSLILVLASALLGLMYWQRPKPPVPQPESQPGVPERHSATPAKPLPTIDQKKPRKVLATNRVQQAQTTGLSTNSKPILIESLPGYLKVLLEQPERLPGPDMIAQLSAKDQPVLMQLYQQTTNLVDRNALTLASGLIGNEEVVALFKNALTQEHAGKELTSGHPKKTDEEYTLFNAVVAMGYLAAKYDSAYDFIKQGADPWFWKNQIQWSSNRGNDTAGMLTSHSIQAIGQSGWPDVPQLLEQLKTKDMVNRVDGDSLGARNYSGSVLQAAFFNDLIQLNGMDAFRNYTLGEGDNDLYKQWRKTENGKKWLAWYETVKRQR